MTEDLKKKILSAETLVAVDDLYAISPEKADKSDKAKEKGLEPLANILLLQKTTKSMEEEAAAFVTQKKVWQTQKKRLPEPRISLRK